MGNIKIFTQDRMVSAEAGQIFKPGLTYTCPNCSGTSGQTVINTTDNFNTRGVFVNDTVSGHASIPAGTIVTAINSNTQIAISAALTGNISAGTTITFTCAKAEDPDFPMKNLVSYDRGKVWRVPITGLPDPFRIDMDFGIGQVKVVAHGWTANDGWDSDVNFDVKYVATGAWPPANSAWVGIGGLADHVEQESSSEGSLTPLKGRRDQIQDLSRYNGASGLTARLWRFEFGSHVGTGNTQGVAGSIKFHLWGDVLDLGIESGPGAEREWVVPRARLDAVAGTRAEYRLGRGRMRFRIPFPSVDHTTAVTNLQKKLLRYGDHPILAIKDFDTKAYQFNLNSVNFVRNFGTSSTSGVYDSALEFDSYP